MLKRYIIFYIMTRIQVINFYLTISVIMINLYINYKADNLIYNYYNQTKFELVPSIYIFQTWNIILFLLCILFLITSCLNNEILLIYSYILTCIFICLYHLFLYYKNIEICIIFLCLIMISLILNIYEIIKHTEYFYIINLFGLFLYWIYFNMILHIFIQLDILNIEYIPIIFMAMLIITKLLLYFPKNKNISYFIFYIFISLFFILLNIGIFINKDPYHYSIFGIITGILCLIYNIIYIYMYKNKNKNDYELLA